MCSHYILPPYVDKTVITNGPNLTTDSSALIVMTILCSISKHPPFRCHANVLVRPFLNPLEYDSDVRMFASMDACAPCNEVVTKHVRRPSHTRTRREGC